MQTANASPNYKQDVKPGILTYQLREASLLIT